jgi:hypothetical protein
MAKNRAHQGETQADRLARLQSGPVEAIGTLLNSINNYFNNEIALTPAHFQTSLLFLGIHAVALTIGEVFFDNRGHDKDKRNYREYLERFVDGPAADLKFSHVADELHDWRNIVAHQWIGSLGHTIEYDYDSPLGWERSGTVLVINPSLYCGQNLQAFAAGGPIWQYDRIFTEPQLAAIQARIVAKYQRR